MSFLLVNLILNILLVTDIKKIGPLCIFLPEINIYKRYSNKTKFMYFMVKHEIFFDKYMTTWEKVSNIIIKKIKVDLYIIKNI